MDAPKESARVQVSPDEDGAALGALVRRATGAPWSAAKGMIAAARVLLDGAVVRDPGHRVRAGQAVEVLRAPRKGDPGALQAGAAGPDAGLAREAVLYIDPHLVVVDKPPGVSTVPFDEGERGALVDRLRVLLHRSFGAPANAPLFVVHRIDKETSGVLVFGRTWLAKRHLAGLFRAHTIERAYLALAHGRFARPAMTFDTNLVENRGDGLRGSAKQPGMGVRAVTHAEVVSPLRGATLIRCRLETGRTHQIRIHLAESGHPILGERVYSRHFAEPMHAAPRLMLHAHTLGFPHPARPDEQLQFVARVPEDFARVARELGARDADLEAVALTPRGT